METCCTCGGPILDTDDGTPGGTACTGTCRHRMCCNWCIVANDRRGRRCRHCLDASAPDGAAPEETVVLSQPCLFDEEELNQMEKDVVATVFEPKLQSHSQMYNCYICEKYTKYKLKCKACEWLTCPVCQECFDDLHGSCKHPRDDDGSIPDFHTGSDGDTEKEIQKRVKSRRTLNQRNERRSKSASSSSRPPEREVSRCYKCKRITLDQSAMCSFCDRTCCQAHKKLMDCCQRWKCEQCICF